MLLISARGVLSIEHPFLYYMGMKTLDKVLIIIGIFLAAFIVATVIIYTYKDWPFDTLIPCVVGGSVLEAVNTMLITVNKIKHGKTGDENDG